MSLANAYALVVGIGAYAHLRPLTRPPLDAQAVAELLVAPERCGYEPAHVRTLPDAQATRQAILDGLQWLATQADSGSTVLFFFAGHGGHDAARPLAGNYLLPVDCDPGSATVADMQKVAASSISSEQLTRALKAIRSGKLAVMFDCCHSGGVGEASRDPFDGAGEMRGGLSEDYYASLAQGQGRAILASCQAGERSWERRTDPNGIFTKHLLAALKGSAAMRDDGLIHVVDVFHELSVRVPPDAAGITDIRTGKPAQQHPNLKADVQDNFALALAPAADRSIGTMPPPPPAPPIRRVRDLQAMIPRDPIRGVEALRDYLIDTGGWDDEAAALGVRLETLWEARRQVDAVGMMSEATKYERRMAIHFALYLCLTLMKRLRPPSEAGAGQ